MRARAAAELLHVPVLYGEIEVARPVDVVVDLDAGRALGFEVRCRDDVRRFLPFGAARVRSDAIEVGSPLTLVDDLAFYLERGASLRSLRGAEVRRAGRVAGALDDVLLAGDGTVTALAVETRAGLVRVPLTPDLRLAPARRVSAA